MWWGNQDYTSRLYCLFSVIAISLSVYNNCIRELLVYYCIASVNASEWQRGKIVGDSIDSVGKSSWLLILIIY